MTGSLAWALNLADRIRLPLRLSLGGFTDHAVNALLAARAEAVRRNHHELTAGHVLLGLATILRCTATEALNRLGVDLGRDADTIAASVGTLEEGWPGGCVVLDSGANRCLERARAEARRSGLSYVGTEHLALAVLAAGGPAADYLTRRDISPERLTAELRALAIPGVWDRELDERP
jgi:ATP-dependent Clp protease ATP-binding subunit ClpC